jgi:hypothetical protein
LAETPKSEPDWHYTRDARATRQESLILLTKLVEAEVPRWTRGFAADTARLYRKQKKRSGIRNQRFRRGG